MVSDIKCPYCQVDQNINHDDGQGFDEGIDYEQQCSKCDKTFIFTTSISYSYSTECLDEPHDMEPFGVKWKGMYECTKCDFYEKRE